jgi:hypothetical protein
MPGSSAKDLGNHQVFALLPAPELGKDCDAAQALQGCGSQDANFAYLHPPAIHASVPRAAAQFRGFYPP